MQGTATAPAESKPRTALETSILVTLEAKPAWVPEIAKAAHATTAKTRNAVARLLDRGVIDITQRGFIALTK